MSLVRSPVFTGQMVDGELEFTYHESHNRYDYSTNLELEEHVAALDDYFDEEVLDFWIEEYNYRGPYAMMVDVLKYCIIHNNEDLRDFVLGNYQTLHNLGGKFKISDDLKYFEFIANDGFTIQYYPDDDGFEDEDDDDDDEWVPNPYIEDYYTAPVLEYKYTIKEMAAPAA